MIQYAFRNDDTILPELAQNEWQNIDRKALLFVTNHLSKLLTLKCIKGKDLEECVHDRDSNHQSTELHKCPWSEK